MKLELVEDSLSPTIIKVIGVGGAGKNAVNRMVEVGIKGVEFIAANTDAQDLYNTRTEHRIQLGPRLTGGLGAGAIPEIGEKAAIESKDQIIDTLKGANMVFITAGMGGGTGTGAAPVIASFAKELKILTVAVVTKPFSFEGPKKMEAAEKGIEKLLDIVDSLIVIKNDNLLNISNKRMTLAQALDFANNVLRYAVQGIAELVTKPGLINLDFADLKTIMSGKGKAVMGIGVGRGENRVEEAVQNVISSPLIDEGSIKGATSMLMNISGGHEITLNEVYEIANQIKAEVDENANIIFGSSLDEQLGDEIRITLVATGFNETNSDVVEPKKVVTTKMELVANKEFDKPAFQRYLKDNFVETSMGNEDKIIKEIKSDVQKDNNLKKDAPQFLIDFDEEDYDIPAFLRQRQ